MRNAFGRLSLSAASAFVLTLAPAQSSLFAEANAPWDFNFCEAAGTSAGTVESVRQVLVVNDIHAFDPGVLEHKVQSETAEQLVIRLDVGPVITFTHKDPQRLQTGQRVRVLLTGSSAEVHGCSPSLA